MIIINGTIRKNSVSSMVVNYVQSIMKDKIKATLTLDGFKEIPEEYLLGTGQDFKYGHKAVILVLSSYYVMPPAAFLNWINQLDCAQLEDLFAEKTVFIISAQAEGNLNELPTNVIRTLLNKIFDFNNIEARICIKHCMVNKENLHDGRIDKLLAKYIC